MISGEMSLLLVESAFAVSNLEPDRLLLPDGRRFVSGSKDGTARIVEHGLVL